MKLGTTRGTIDPPKRRTPPKKTPPKRLPPGASIKDVRADDETEAKEAAVATVERPREETPELAPPGGRERPAGRPRPADSEPDEPRLIEGQTTIEALTKLEYGQLLPLWKRLNKGAGDRFHTLRKPDDLPKNRYMRKAEAVQRGKVPASKPARDALFCPYCMTYMPFQRDTYMNYVRCCGCGISTKDFHTHADNPHFVND